MLRVKLSDGREYVVLWHHQVFDEPRVIAMTDRRIKGTTRCFIFPPGADTKNAMEASAIGLAHCSVLDQYDKDRGRRISLGRAVHSIITPKKVQKTVKVRDRKTKKVREVKKMMKHDDILAFDKAYKNRIPEKKSILASEYERLTS